MSPRTIEVLGQLPVLSGESCLRQYFHCKSSNSWWPKCEVRSSWDLKKRSNNELFELSQSSRKIIELPGTPAFQARLPTAWLRIGRKCFNLFGWPYPKNHKRSPWGWEWVGKRRWNNGVIRNFVHLYIRGATKFVGCYILLPTILKLLKNHWLLICLHPLLSG